MAQKCASCGAAKPAEAPRCPACQQMDEDVVRKMVAGTPGLTLLILGLVGFSIYRFWIVGWPAWSGNLRLVALCAGALGFTALIFGPLWTFGIRTRRTALIIFIVGTAVFLILNNV